SAVAVRVNGIRQFTATVSGATDGSVTWSLTPPPGVSASVIGSIDVNGTYAAPPSPLPGFASLTVTATGVALPTATASTTITVLNRLPSLTSVAPSSLPLGAFNLTVTGTKFVRGARVKWNGAPLATTFVSASQLTATGTAAQVGSVAITVANSGPSAESQALALSVTSRLAVSITPASTSVAPGGTIAFQVAVSGSANQAVVWSVAGGAANGVIDATGQYTALDAAPVAGLVTVYAVAAADGVTRGSATVSIQDPQAITNGRFLEQSTYGPTPALMARIRQLGISAFLEEQLGMPESPWPDPAAATRADAIDAFFGNAFTGQDQLRQRVIGALSEIFVVSMNKNTNGNEIIPWLALLSRNAFGNYRTLLRQITRDAA